jgi:dTDP-4-amino-4,6-dideoxygalactose transaminase
MNGSEGTVKNSRKGATQCAILLLHLPHWQDGRVIARHIFGYRVGDFPVTEDLGRRSLALPFSGVMEEAQVDLVCEALAGILK